MGKLKLWPNERCEREGGRFSTDWQNKNPVAK